MSYQIIPNIIFIFSVFGILLIILRHLPEADAKAREQALVPTADERLLEKGLPAQAISKIRVNVTFAVKKVWHFVLEAKDLRPHAATGYKMKRLFSPKAVTTVSHDLPKPQVIAEVRNERFYLDSIKLHPKDLSNYDSLGKFYIEQGNLNDAQDLYLYLVNHEPSNPEYQARLAFCYYKTHDYKKAAEHYEKSLALDSTQPNRYYNLSLALKASGKKKEAGVAIHKALDLEPNNPKYLETLKLIEKV